MVCAEILRDHWKEITDYFETNTCFLKQGINHIFISDEKTRYVRKISTDLRCLKWPNILFSKTKP